MSVIEDSMKAAAKAAEAAARFCKTMMRLEHPSHYKETKEEQFVSDWFVTRKMDKEPTYADAIAWADKTMIDRLRELKRDYELELDAEPRVYEIHIQLCAKLSLIEKLIQELEE